MKWDASGEWVPPAFTHHAENRRREMGVSTDEVLLVVADCEVSYQQGDYDNNATVFKRDGLSVVVDTTGNRIVTILWNTDKEYNR